MFQRTFSAFPWEVHDGFHHPKGELFLLSSLGILCRDYESNQGEGQMIEMSGFAVAVGNDKLQLMNTAIFMILLNFLMFNEATMLNTDGAQLTIQADKRQLVELDYWKSLLI